MKTLREMIDIIDAELTDSEPDESLEEASDEAIQEIENLFDN